VPRSLPATQGLSQQKAYVSRIFPGVLSAARRDSHVLSEETHATVGVMNRRAIYLSCIARNERWPASKGGSAEETPSARSDRTGVRLHRENVPVGCQPLLV
jgi:hypothetical protein